MKALILAAGVGSRLGLKDIPKPMYKIEGRSILEHNILLLKKHNIKDICINLHYMPDVIKDYCRDGSKWEVNIQYSPEKKLLGTSGTVKDIEWFWGKSKEPFFVLYGDNYTKIDLTEMLHFHLANKPLATIALFDPKTTANSGIAGGLIEIDQNNSLISFTEGDRNKATGYVNAGVYILEQEILDMIPAKVPSDFGKDVFPELIKKKILLKGYITKSFVLAIDTKEALAQTKKKIQEK